MHHNDVDYWRYLMGLPPGDRDLPSPRVCRLLQRTFQQWREKPRWLDEGDVGHLFRGRTDLTPAQQQQLSALPVPVRKARAIRRMFELITRKDIAGKAGSFDVNPDELIVGTLPPFSVGQGKEFVRYLTETEELNAMLSYLNELSPMGHIVPNYHCVVDRGLLSLIDECKESEKTADAQGKVFYQACREALEAVIFYASRYADEVSRVASRLAQDDERRATLSDIAKRMARVPAKRAESFVDAVQSIYIVHCALHWSVEIVPLGRLDQILHLYYEADIARGDISPVAAQEILDCFWVKLDERAILNRRHLENRFTACDGTLTGFFGSSNFDQGGLLNQWMQQITIGGVQPNDDEIPTDACNAITRMCLECARRLPLNSPTLDLRVHSRSPPDVLKLAAEALLSGGAHPVLLNDEKIVAGLRGGAANQISLAAARNYACDGCYETMVAGESEFSFGFVAAPDLVEKALNRGASFAGSGPVHLRGLKDSWRTEPAVMIKTWEEFWSVVLKHMELGCHRYVRSLLLNYGNKADIAPSPLLSALITGCIERGRDLTSGGSNYHIFSPLLTGISTATDSLFAIKSLVFERQLVRMDEMITALATDWGSRLVSQEGHQYPAYGTGVTCARIDAIRRECESQMKFGFGHSEVDVIAWDLINAFCNAVRSAWQAKEHQPLYEKLQKQFSTKERQFQMFLVPGVGTFEQYVFAGSFLGASADGRGSGESIASDLSPAPVHRHLAPVPENGSAPHSRIGSLVASFSSYSDTSMCQLGDGAPADYNIPENFPLDKLADRLTAFAKGEGGSIATFTVADPETFAQAQARPSDYNLLRVRMGGWTEFFVCLFPEHQEQHRRRPLFTD